MKDEIERKVEANKAALQALASSDLPAAPIAKAILNAKDSSRV